VGAPGMSSEAYEFYKGVFKNVYDSKEWQDYMKTKSLIGEFITGNDLEDYWQVNYETHEKMLKEIGELK